MIPRFGVEHGASYGDDNETIEYLCCKDGDFLGDVHGMYYHDYHGGCEWNLIEPDTEPIT